MQRRGPVLLQSLCLKGVVLARWHLFQSSGMDDNRDSRQRPLEAPLIAHISNEVAQALMIEPRGPHFVLLEFIAAENDQPLGAILPQHNFDELLPERSRPARH